MQPAVIALQEKIYETIPLSRAMAFTITELTPTRIVTTAPLEPNINIHGTGFAGSIYALGALTAWAYGTYAIEEAGITADVVIAEANIRYSKPLQSDIRCKCELPLDEAQLFINQLDEKGRAVINLDITIGDEAATLWVKLHARHR